MATSASVRGFNSVLPVLHLADHVHRIERYVASDITIKDSMFAGRSMSKMLKDMKTKTMASLDLSLPVSVRALHSSSNAKTLGELDVVLIYDQLSNPFIESFNLAGVEKYHIRPSRPDAVIHQTTTKTGKVQIMENDGRLLFVANPNVFFPITPNRKPTMVKEPLFRQFMQLPREIRHNIWALAAEPRHLVAREVCTASVYLASWTDPWCLCLALVAASLTWEFCIVPNISI